MRYLFIFCLIICFDSCKSKSEVTSTAATEFASMVCPEDGTCSFEIIENKTLLIKTDNLGSAYPEMVDGSLYVLKFEYKKHGNANYEDSSYREEIFIELNANNLETETVDLKDKKLFFARWCYCKGQTGYYKINKGKLAISKIDDKNFQIHLSFKMDEVPQIINEINYTFSLQ